MNRVRVFRFLFLLLILFLLMVVWPSVSIAKMVSINGNSVNMRSGPGLKYMVLWELGDGFPLKVLKKKNEWLRVQDFEGSIGWVHYSVVIESPHMIVKVNKKSKKQINVRSGPGTNYPIIAKAYYGVVFKTVLQKNGWVKIEHDKGVSGWIKRTLLWGW